MLEHWQILTIISSIIIVVLIGVVIYLSYLLGQKKGYSVGYRDGKREQIRTNKRKRINLYNGHGPETVRVIPSTTSGPVHINRRNG